MMRAPMPLTPGTRLGPYETVAVLGSGGMGDVYEAIDTRLNRRVALKVLPPTVAASPERRRRFVQEAQLASALQHPHIVTIFDIGTDHEVDYLAMELVRGRTLASVIPPKGLRLADALRYAIQIADALTAAHTAGIVHRDLKPTNIMVTDQDQIKILDFGLATLVERGLSSEGDETRLQAAIKTGAGTILGTVAYMSPEQAEGKKVDARSDIFALGAILYEMLSGQRAFQGDSAPATLAAVIALEPRPLSNLGAHVTPEVERLVSRCLRKDVSRRAQHASDVKLALEELKDDSTSGTVSSSARPPGQRRRGVVVGAVAVAGVALAALTWRGWSRPASPPSAFMAAPLTALPGSEQYASFSPDATQVAFEWTPEGTTDGDVYVQLVSGAGLRLRLANDGRAHRIPSWSPDGKSIALWEQAGANEYRLNLVSALGGPERTLMTWTDLPCPIAWSPDSRWLAISPVNPRGRLTGGITLVSPDSGERIEWTALDRVFVGSADPSFSPDGTRLVYTRSSGDFTGQINMISIGPDGRPVGAPATLDHKGQESHNPIWTADGGSLLVIEGDSSSNGGVTRIPIGAPDRAQRLAGLERAKTLTISRDGTRLAFARGGDNVDIWRFDLRDASQSGRLAPSTLWDGDAQYSPDGTRLVFASNRSGPRELWVGDADGNNAQPITRFNGPVPGTPRWSPDGQQIAFDGRPDGHSDIFIVSAGGGPVRRVTERPGEDARPAWSADGRSIYFSSDRSGRPEIWRMNADGSNPSQITTSGALAVLAAPDGETLFYKRASGPVHRIRTDGTHDEPANPEPAFAFLPFALTRSALWFVTAPTPTRPEFAVRMMRFADGTTSDAARFDWIPSGLALSVSPDERFALFTRLDTTGTDLLIVNDFK
jgi:Tol biopolymer transport system component